MTSFEEQFAPYESKILAEGLPELVVNTFKHYYSQLVAGATGLIAEDTIDPLSSLPDAETLGADFSSAGRGVIKKTVLIKLNGGLGTSMGLDGPKSLLVVKNGLSFLDVTVRQSLELGTPLVLMNSFATNGATLAALAKGPYAPSGIPVAFQQHKVPKVAVSDLRPADWEADRRLEWCPPGHGDIYAALITSGMLAKLLQAGYEYAFISNIDNLGAVLDETLLGYFHSQNYPFMLEAADRTEADRKGGHLARLHGGQLILREVAQCPREELEFFQDTARHRYFNTNNLWLKLRALQSLIETGGPVIRLPLIRNLKPIDPQRRDSPEVYQLETAMGSAIHLFEGAAAIRVSRKRLAPVKTTDDLLRIRSDAYCLTDDYRIVLNPKRTLGELVINLDPAYYGLINNFDAHFPRGVPSLVECERLDVRGDIKFGQGVTLSGKIHLINESAEQLEIEDGAVVRG